MSRSCNSTRSSTRLEVELELVFKNEAFQKLPSY